MWGVSADLVRFTVAVGRNVRVCRRAVAGGSGMMGGNTLIRERMGQRKNLFHRMLSVLLVFALAAVSVLGTGRGIRAESEGRVIYLDGVSGDDSRDGESAKEAVATFSRAKKLVGDKGTIRVCGTVTVSGSQSWSLGSGVKLKKASGFDGAVAHVTGSLKLSGISLYNTDISGSGSVSGLAGRSPAADITVPSTITMVQPKALSELSLSDQCFGVGSFVWADGSFVPDKYETQAQIIFTPSDTDVHDYSGLKGWNGDSQTVVRSVKVLTQSFLEEEKKEEGSDGREGTDGKEDGQDQKDQEGSDQAQNEAGDAGQDQKGTDDKAEDAGQDQKGSDDKAEDAGQNEDGSPAGEAPEDEKKPEEGSDTEDGKANGVPNTDEQKPEEGKSDAAPGKDGQTPGDGEDAAPGSVEDKVPGDGNEASGDDRKPEENGEVPEGGSDSPAGEETPGDPADGKEEIPDGQPAAEEKKDEPAESWNVEKVEKLLAKLPDNIGSQSDVDAVVQASGAYEQLDDEAQAAVSGGLLDKLYDAQSRVLAFNRVSMGVTVQGDLPWYIQFRASSVEGRKIDDSTVRTLLESYDFQLWNLFTDSEYKLNGKTVIVQMAAPVVKDVDIVIYHYLEDGTVEHIIPEIDGDQMRFAASSFSPFSVIGVSVAGSTELVGSTGFSYINKTPSSGSGTDKKDTGNKSGSSTGITNNGNSSSASGNKSTGSSSGNKSTGSSSTGNKKTSSSASSVSGSQKNSTGQSGSGVRRTNAVGTGDTNNLLGYAMVGSGAALLMLFAAYMIYVQVKRRSYSRRS